MTCSAGSERRGGQVQRVPADYAATAGQFVDPPRAHRAGEGLLHPPGRCVHHRAQLRQGVHSSCRGQTGLWP